MPKLDKQGVEFDVFRRLDPQHRMQIVAHDLQTLLQADRRRRFEGSEKGKTRKTRIVATSPRLPNRHLIKITPPDRCTFVEQLMLVRDYADLRRDRIDEIVDQRYDILSFFGLNGLLHPDRSKWTLTLLLGVQGAVAQLGMPLKHLAYCPRPIDYSRRVMPIIETPTHSTFPSGHACEAFAVAMVLRCLMHRCGVFTNSDGSPKEAPSLQQEDLRTVLANFASIHEFRIAHRIAENRVVAGVHFPVDNVVGAIIGIMVGACFVWAMAGPRRLRPMQKQRELERVSDADWNKYYADLEGVCSLPKVRVYASNLEGDFALAHFQKMIDETMKRSEKSDEGNQSTSAKADDPVAIDEPMPVENASPLMRRVWREALREWHPTIGSNSSDGDGGK
ncbi:MAG: phosphatase PAP2 family protein [Pseudomonadota bacterium]